MARSGVECAAPPDRQEPEASVLAGVPRSVHFAPINVATTGTSSVAGCGFRKFWHTLTQALQSAPARPSKPRRASLPEGPKSRSTAFCGSSSGCDQDDSPTAPTRLDSGTTPLRAPLIGPLSTDQRPPSQIPADNSNSAPQVGYVGEVNVRVAWNAQEVGGTVQTVISNLQDSNGDTYRNNDLAVRELVFPTVPVTVTADGALGIDADSGGKITIVREDRSTDTTALTLDSHIGTFVGASSDGPLGIMGTYSTGSAVGDLTGAYGADLP